MAPPPAPPGIPGVFVLVNNFATNAAKLGGYLGFDNLKDFWALFDQPETKKLILDYRSLKSAKYNVSGSPTQFSTKIAFDIFRERRYASLMVSKTIPLITETMSPDTYVKLVHAWFLNKVMRANRSVFRESTFHEETHPECYSPTNITPEDLYRAHWLVRFGFKHLEEGVKRRGGATIAPKFASGDMTEAESRVATDTKAGLPGNLRVEDMFILPEESDEIGDDEDLDTIEDILTETAILKLSRNNPKRQAMTAEVRKELLDALARKATVCQENKIYPDEEQMVVLSDLIAKRDSKAKKAEDEGSKPEAEPEANSDNVLPEDITSFTETSAPEIPYHQACEILNVDPLNPTLFSDGPLPLHLNAWQVKGVATMLMAERGKLRGGLLSDAPGLGKTIQMFTLIALAPRVNRLVGPYKPTLFLCPSGILNVLITEFDRWFRGVLDGFIYHRSKAQTTDPIRKDLTINPDDLSSWLENLDENDPRTAQTVLMASTETWHERTTVKTIVETFGGREVPKFECKYRDRFFRVVVDEAHSLKTVGTGIHQNVKSMNYHAYWGMTATALINRSVDLLGQLNLLWREEWKTDDQAIINVTKNVSHTDIAESKDASLDKIKESILKDTAYDQVRKMATEYSVRDDGPALHLLQPSLFKSFTVNGDITAADARVLLPVIQESIMLRRGWRSQTEVISEGQITTTMIGATIPKYSLTLVELEFSRETQKEHDRLYFPLIEKLKPGVSSDQNSASLADGLPESSGDKQGRINFHVIRRLSQLSLAPKMERFARNTSKKNLSKDIRMYQEKYSDGGATYFFRKTVKDTNLAIPQTCLEMAYYLAADCPKLQYISGIISDLVIGQKRRTMFVFGWPGTCWKGKQFMEHIQLGVLVLHAGMRPDEKKKVADLWNDPNSPYDVLLTTYRTGSIGLNLHLVCHTMVLVDVPQNIGIAIQTIGRVYRIGQTESPDIYVLSQRHTWNRSEEFNCAKKMLGQIAGDYGSFMPSIDPGDGLGEASTVAKECHINRQIKNLVMDSDRILQATMGWEQSRLVNDDWGDLGFGWGTTVDGKILLDPKHKKKSDRESKEDAISITPVKQVDSELPGVLMGRKKSVGRARARKAKNVVEEDDQEEEATPLKKAIATVAMPTGSTKKGSGSGTKEACGDEKDTGRDQTSTPTKTKPRTQAATTKPKTKKPVAKKTAYKSQDKIDPEDDKSDHTEGDSPMVDTDINDNELGDNEKGTVTHGNADSQVNGDDGEIAKDGIVSETGDVGNHSVEKPNYHPEDKVNPDKLESGDADTPMTGIVANKDIGDDDVCGAQNGDGKGGNENDTGGTVASAEIAAAAITAGTKDDSRSKSSYAPSGREDENFAPPDSSGVKTSVKRKRPSSPDRGGAKKRQGQGHETNGNGDDGAIENENTGNHHGVERERLGGIVNDQNDFNQDEDVVMEEATANGDANIGDTGMGHAGIGNNAQLEGGGLHCLKEIRRVPPMSMWMVTFPWLDHQNLLRNQPERERPVPDHGVERVAE